MRTSKYKNYEDLPLMLSVPEVGEVLGISRAGAYELVRTAGFPHIKIGNRIVVPRINSSHGSMRIRRWSHEKVEEAD